MTLTLTDPDPNPSQAFLRPADLTLRRLSARHEELVGELHPTLTLPLTLTLTLTLTRSLTLTLTLTLALALTLTLTRWASCQRSEASRTCTPSRTRYTGLEPQTKSSQTPVHVQGW
eukprot:scaffold10021_cov29-Phaeocystis_antarctica.AAC.1